MRGQGSREGQFVANRARGLDARRVLSGLRRELQVGVVSAWCEGRAAERAGGLQLGPGASDREGDLEAERGSTCGCCECLVRRQGNREGNGVAIRARGKW